MFESSEIRKKINDSVIKMFNRGSQPAKNNQNSGVVFEDRGGEPLTKGAGKGVHF